MKRIKLLETIHNPEMDEKFHQLNFGNIGNVIYWWKFFEMLSGIPGDIVECGVGRGRSLLIISAINYLLTKNEGGERTIFAYDSFEGFPEPTIEDKSQRNPQRGEWASSPSGRYKYSIEFTKKVLFEAKLPLDSLSLNIKKGFFCDSLKGHPDRPIALLHMDGDLYQSYKDCLNHLYNKVCKGGIIVFDDFQEGVDSDPFPGSRLAIKEFFGERYKNLKVSVGGTYYFVKD
jgi:hypothetical protein